MEEDIDGEEETHSRRDCNEASAGRGADGPRPAGERGDPDDWSDGSKLRDELLDGEIFYTLNEAKIVIETWRRHYNTLRPHSSLGYRPPAPETTEWPGSLASPPGARPANPPVVPNASVN